MVLWYGRKNMLEAVSVPMATIHGSIPAAVETGASAMTSSGTAACQRGDKQERLIAQPTDGADGHGCEPLVKLRTRKDVRHAGEHAEKQDGVPVHRTQHVEREYVG